MLHEEILKFSGPQKCWSGFWYATSLARDQERDIPLVILGIPLCVMHMDLWMNQNEDMKFSILRANAFAEARPQSHSRLDPPKKQPPTKGLSRRDLNFPETSYAWSTALEDQGSG